MELIGKIHVINQTEVISDKFQKREFVLETADNPLYPQYIKLEVTQDRVSMLDAWKVGDMAKCLIDIRGREWKSPQGEIKYFNTIQCWKMELAQGVPEAAQAVTAEVSDDDLPF